MSRYAITHVDAQRVRRHLVVGAANRAMAWECAERLYGSAWFMSCKKA